MKIPSRILDDLRDRVTTNGHHLVLTGPRMTTRDYQRVNDILEATGGQWDKSMQAHVVPIDAAEALAPVLASGEVVTLREKRQSSQYFPTPDPVVERLLALADLTPGMRVLEPSAGSGAIADAARAAGAVVECVERDPGYAAVLAEAGHEVRVGDFLAVPPEPRFDRVVMNPPFTRGTDMAHVEHALRFLAPDGLLVSVMSIAVAEHTRHTAAFRALVEARGGSAEAVPERAFAASGTTVDTLIVTIPARRPDSVQPLVWPVREQPTVAEPELGSPAEILAEIKASLRDALAEVDALEELLNAPTAQPIEIPAPRQEEQLAFDLTDEGRAA